MSLLLAVVVVIMYKELFKHGEATRNSNKLTIPNIAFSALNRFLRMLTTSTANSIIRVVCMERRTLWSDKLVNWGRL